MRASKNKNRSTDTSSKSGRKPGAALKRWRFFAVFWPLACVVFACLILLLPGRNLDETIADTMFTVFPLVFFAIGMRSRRRLIEERQYATVLTTATVVSEGRTTRTGHNTAYFPEFQFQVGALTYHVKSPSGSGSHFVSRGARVELYYAPENPRIFYVPAIHRYHRRVSGLFCGIGIVFPLAGLFAPLIRALFLMTGLY